MIADNPRSPHNRRSGVSKPLKRGKACLVCRSLKIKCDGQRPICEPCRTNPKDVPCRYADSPAVIKTKQLEEHVERLEQRLYDLENPGSTTPSVTLRDPYGTFSDSPLSSKGPALLIPDPAPFGPLSPFSPTSTSSSLPSGRHWNNFAALETMTESIGSSGSSTSPARQVTSSPFLGLEEPSHLLMQNLLDKFLPHALHFGFFLHIPAFRASALLPEVFGHHRRPSPALLSAVYLWGVHFSRSEALLREENAFLTRALQHTVTDLLGSHPRKVIHTLQAEILLSYYFYRTGRFLEAKTHTSSAVSLALGSQLNLIRSVNHHTPSAIGIVSGSPMTLHPPTDFLEEGERINGFWAVFTLHKMLSVALEAQTNVCGALEAPGIQIDTPWPLDIGEYREGLLNPEVVGNATVKNFLGNPSSDFHTGDSITALVVKASVLYHRTAHLIGHWRPTLQERELQAFSVSFQSMHALIESFRMRLPRISQFEPRNPNMRSVLLAHALTDAATIKLHGTFAYSHASSKQSCINSARNIVRLGDVNLQEVGYINPIVGALWMTACYVFIDEISRGRSTANIDLHIEGGLINEEELFENLRAGMKGLSLFSEDSVLMMYQLTKVHEAYSAI